MVDGGFSDTGQTVIEHIGNYYFGADTVIHHVVLSHADNDHACGLIKIIKHFDVRTIWMNRPWLCAAEVIDDFHGNFTVDGLVQRMKEMHPYLAEIEEIAKERGIPIYEVFQGSVIGQFTVLAPS